MSSMGTGKKTVEQRYQKKTQLEHILLRPDTYVGSTEHMTSNETWIVEKNKLNVRDIRYVP